VIFSATSRCCSGKLPYLERPAAAAEAGFTVVETWWPGEELVDAWVDEVDRSSLDVRLLNCDGGDIEAGERGFLKPAGATGGDARGVQRGRRCGRPLRRRPTSTCSSAGTAAGAPRGEQLRIAAGVLSECVDIGEEAASGS